MLAFLSRFGEFYRGILTQREHAGFAIGFNFEVETVGVIESIKFFFRFGSAALRISEHRKSLSISYTAIVLT
ncbi:hypothetical protein BHG07_03175 [Brenneria salicis ATCC 15712 = DSM 30166]|nr:hypothetical protein BHG07_03175 [Brenneria salicis ATCC 15712 = DSM 30166]